jgi:dihydroorotase
MRWIIQSALIIDPKGKHHNKVRDVLIENGIIQDIKSSLKAEKEDHLINAKGMNLSLGWIDLKANFRDPGFEYKEGLLNGLDAAAKGGFTRVLCMPSTLPAIDSKAQVVYLKSRSAGHPVDLLPAGCISQGGKGQQMSEMFDMMSAGAVAFSDDKPIERTALMNRSLDYSRELDVPLMSICMDPDLADGGVMHEGKMSNSLGLKGIPSVAEEIRVAREIEVLRYSGGKLHLMLLSSKRAVEMVRKAKKEGLNITAGVAAQQLCFTDKDLASFDSNLKVLPPFREESDRLALIKGLKDGTIDVICSNHEPENIENKKREFEHAAFGNSTIEATFSLICKGSAAKLDIDQIVQALAVGPRQVLGEEQQSIELGNKAEFTLFSVDATSEYTRDSWISKSMNSSIIGQTLPGKVYGIVNGEQLVLQED